MLLLAAAFGAPAARGVPASSLALSHHNTTSGAPSSSHRALGHRVQMNGQCAVIARGNVWKDEVHPLDPVTGVEIEEKVLSSTDRWDYRLKVDPWTVFGQVDLDILGTNLVIEHVWAADVVSIVGITKGGKKGLRVTLELSSRPQDDQQLDIDGTGIPATTPTIAGCRDLELQRSSCKLGTTFRELNLYAGVLSAQVDVDTWQEAAKVTLAFGQQVTLKEVWGALLDEIDEGDATSAATFRLMPYNHHTPLDRRSAFGFDATPPFHHQPKITCVPVRPFPPPPPPSPPRPPPSPPPYFEADDSDCFLRGRATFTVTPSTTAGIQWGVRVHLVRWQPGVQVTLNFVGDHLREHPIRIYRIEPADTARETIVTSHSMTLELLPAPVHEFIILAYGLVEGLGKLACCCADFPEPPPPPPAPPPAAREIAIGSALAPPRPPEVTIVGGGHREEVQIQGRARDEGGGEIRLDWGHVAAAVAGFAALAAIALRVLANREAARHAAMEEATAGIADAVRGKRRGGGGGGVQLSGGRRQRTKLHIELAPGEKQAVYISLGDCDSLGDVQAQIADVCEEAGLDGLTDDLVMSYQRDDGSYATVTRSVPLEAIVEAPTLRLKPAKSKKGRR